MENIFQTVHRTPLKQSATINKMTGADVYLKMENLQLTGSFKIRGALNKIIRLSPFEGAKGIIAASAGNHAQGVSYSAARRGFSAKVFMPADTPEAKVHATRSYGATTVLVGETYQEAYEAALSEQEEKGATFVHAFDDIDVIAGQGTVALEMMQQCSDLEAIIVPVGGGGLLSGVATAVKSLYPNVKLIGVQAAGAAATFNRFTGKGKSPLNQVHTIAEGICVKEPGALTFPIINRLVDDIVTVTDDEIAFAIMLMLEREKALVEGAGAAALAALLSKNLNLSGKRVGMVVSGGNIDPEKLGIFKEISRKVEAVRKIG